MLFLSEEKVEVVGAGNVESIGVPGNVPIAAGGGEEENNGDASEHPWSKGASIEAGYAARDLSQS